MCRTDYFYSEKKLTSHPDCIYLGEEIMKGRMREYLRFGQRVAFYSEPSRHIYAVELISKTLKKKDDDKNYLSDLFLSFNL